jgi:glycosyltransferase involved in cell wall biosynthesis
MENMYHNRENILKIKAQVDILDPSLFDHVAISNCEINDSTISIVMTASNRSKQTYYTLDSIARSTIRSVHLIIVDDSVHDPLTVERLRSYPFYIDFIQINRANKYWHNPCVNYNIGFKFIKGSKVIIQNAEVCHIGDVCAHVSSKINDNEYHAFDVNSTLNFDCNEIIYNSSGTYEELITKSNIYQCWYQSQTRNLYFHFLTALTRDTFNKIKEFSYDYAFGIAYDDCDLVLKIKSLGITFINVFHEENNIMGIHLHHSSTENLRFPFNKSIFETKDKKCTETGKYIDFIV